MSKIQVSNVLSVQSIQINCSQEFSTLHIIMVKASMMKRMDLQRETTYYVRYRKGLDSTGVSYLVSTWGHEGTRTNQDSRIIYITEKPEHAQSTTFGLVVEASLLRLTGWFHIHLFLSMQGLKCAYNYTNAFIISEDLLTADDPFGNDVRVAPGTPVNNVYLFVGLGLLLIVAVIVIITVLLFRRMRVLSTPSEAYEPLHVKGVMQSLRSDTTRNKIFGSGTLRSSIV